MVRRRVRKGRSKRKFKKKVRKVFKKMMRKRKQKKRARSSGAPTRDLGIGAQLFEKRAATMFKSRLSNSSRLLKAVAANEKTFIQTIRGIQPYRNTTTRPISFLGDIFAPELGGGAYWLYNAYKPLIGRVYSPCITVDLTSCQNLFVDPAGAYQLTNYNPVKRLSFNQAGTNVPATEALFDDLGAYLADGATVDTSGWQSNVNSALPGGQRIYPSDKCMLRSTEIDLFFYGAASYATEFCIQIIKIKDDWLAPEVMQDTTSSVDYRLNQLAFWDWYVKQYAAHPLASQPSQANHMKVLAEKKFTLQQVTSNEGTYFLAPYTYPVSTGGQTGNFGNVAPGGPPKSIGHNQRIKMTLPWNKALNFNWQNQGRDSAGLSNPSSTALQIGQATGTVRPKSRIYLTIRALNPVTTTISAPPAIGTPFITPANTPSFDMKLRNVFTQLS